MIGRYCTTIKLRTLLLLALTLTVTLVVAGCSLDKPFPNKSLHSMSIGDLPKPAGPAGKAVLRVETVHIARPFDSSTFVYKLGGSNFTVDYYSGFIAPPDKILSAELAEWIGAAGIFANVIDGPSRADYQLSLESNVTALYGDYSDPKKPAAVIEIRFFLIDDHDGRYRIAFAKTYHEAEPLAGNKPEQLVEGWSAAYRRILTSLSQDMRQSPVAELANVQP